MYFYPNECYVCETTNSLKQCSGCRMVSYCGEPHQKVDWKNHKTFCRAISTILRINHQSHIFEGLKGLSRHKWMDESKNMWTEIMLYLNRALFPNEEEMLQFPRVCFVCFEARQNYLKNCPNCPFASFCKEHPSSPIHDKDCHEIKMVHDKKVLVVPSEERIQLNILVASLKKSEKPPLSMEDLMDQQFGGQTDIKENVKYYVSEAMSVPLTLYNAFQKLNQPLQSEIVVHVQGVANVHVFIQSWESILHLMPHIISLTIVFIDSKQNSCTNVALCNKCLLAKKKLIVEVPTLPYVKYVKKKSCRKPNLLAMFMMDLYYCTRDQFRMWHENLNYWNTSSCPIVIAYKGNVERFVIENLHPYICNSSLYYMGLNSFSPLYPCLNPYDWTCCKNSMNIIIAKSPCESRMTTAGEGNLIDGATLEKYQEEDDVDDPDNSIEWKKRLWRRSFYHSVCYVCQAMNPTLACKKCKMIFYCGENHRRVHWPYHKMICRAILGMLNETGATSVFDQLPKDNEALWLKGKFDLLKRTEMKIGKELTDGEREMFLFPKTCFICHANDSSILKNCKCGISFCKIDMKNANHKEQCKDFSLVRKLTLMLEPRVMNLDVKVLPKKSNSYPETIEDFIKNCLKFNHEEFSIPNLQTILLSDYLSRTLTFLYCAELLMDPCYFENDSLVIHVIGATMREKHEAVFWKFVLYWFDHMKNLKVIFIGPEVETKVQNTQQSLLARFDFSSIAYMRYQNLETKSYAMKYEDYYVHDEFIEPEIIIGFNLNIHESEPNTWNKLAAVLTKIDCQFIMTAKSKARSFKEDNAMEKILFALDYHTINYSNDINPYASLIPERDHQIEGLCYSNKCITFCTLLERRYRSLPSGKTLQQLEIEVEMRRLFIEKNLRENKRAVKHAKKAAMRRAEHSLAKKQKQEVKVSSVEIMPGLESNDETSSKIESTSADKLKKSEKSPKIEPKVEKLSDLVARLKKSTETEKSPKVEGEIEESSKPGKSSPEMIAKIEESTEAELKIEKSPEVAAKIETFQDYSLNEGKNKKHEDQEEKSDRIIRKALRRIVRIDGKEEKQETVRNGENYSSEVKKDKRENFLKIGIEKETMSTELGKFEEKGEDVERKLKEDGEKLKKAKEENGRSEERKLKEDEEKKLKEDEEKKLKEDEEKVNKKTDNKEKLKEDKEAKGNNKGKFNEAKEIEEGKLKEDKKIILKEKTDSKEKLEKVEEGKIKEEIIPLGKLKEDNKVTLKEDTDSEEKLKEVKKEKIKEDKEEQLKEVKKGKINEDKEEQLKEKKENEEKKAKENKKEKLTEAKKIKEEISKEKKEDEEEEAKENIKHTLNEKLKPETKKIEETKSEKTKIDETKIEKLPQEEKGESSKTKNPPPSGSKKSKNKKQSKLENETTILEANEEISNTKEIEKPEKIPEGKKAKNKKPAKNEKEIPISEENPQISDNDSGAINKRGKNKKSKNDQNPKEKEINLQEEIITKTENVKKSKNKKQTKLEKDEKEEVDNKKESQETQQESKEATKKSEITEMKSLNENIEKKPKSKKQKLKNQIKSEIENTAVENAYTLLVERNKLLEEHLFLMRENEKLKKENSKLRAEGERLRRENNDCNDDLINKTSL